MKKVLFAIGGVAALIGVAYFVPSTTEYVAQGIEVKEVVKEVTVPELDKRVREAITASSTEIEHAANKAAEDKRAAMESDIKLRVINQMKAELEVLEAQEEEKVSL